MNWTRRSPGRSLELVRRPVAGRTRPRRLGPPRARAHSRRHPYQKRPHNHQDSARLWPKADAKPRPRRRRAARRSLTRGRRPMKWRRRGPTSVHLIKERTGLHTTPRLRRRACAGPLIDLFYGRRRRRRSWHLSHYVSRAREYTARRAFLYCRPLHFVLVARGSPACCMRDPLAASRRWRTWHPPRHRCGASTASERPQTLRRGRRRTPHKTA